jgi:hypothetical protein
MTAQLQNQVALRQSEQIIFNPRPLTERMDQRGDNKFKILSIDGGGTRGIIPLKILVELEGHIGPISETFDLIGGTSTGGIIALCLTASRTELSAREVSCIKHVNFSRSK